ncbi:hypothetical protein ACOMHN_054350 [Nucella lapillus]
MPSPHDELYAKPCQPTTPTHAHPHPQTEMGRGGNKGGGGGGPIQGQGLEEGALLRGETPSHSPAHHHLLPPPPSSSSSPHPHHPRSPACLLRYQVPLEKTVTSLPFLGISHYHNVSTEDGRNTLMETPKDKDTQIMEKRNVLFCH